MPSRGQLTLVFRTRGGQTYLAAQYVQAPYKILRPFVLDDGRAALQILNVGPGLLAGDEYALDVHLEAGAKVVLINQAATKLHTMEPGMSASQRVTLRVDEQAELEYYPGLTVPFPGSAFKQRLHVQLSPSARFGVLESWATGRIRRGETLRFRQLSSRTRVYVDGVPVYQDALELTPRSHKLAGWGLLEGHAYYASGYWRWTDGPTLEDVTEPNLLAVTGKPPNGHVYLRALAQDSAYLSRYLQCTLRALRQHWLLAEVGLERFSSAF